MAKIRRRKLPSGAVAYQVTYRDGNGTRRAKQFPKRRDAEAWMARALVEVQEGRHAPDSASITIRHAVERYMDHCQLEVDGGRLERGTMDFYRRLMHLHALDTDIGIGHMKCSQLTRAAANAFRDRLLQNRSENVTRRVLGTLSLAIENARDNGLVSVNNLRGVKIRRSPRGHERVEIPSKADVGELLGRSTGMMRPVLAIAAFCGLRVSEILGLRWKDVDFEGKQISIRQRVDRWSALGHPKSAAGIRDVPMGRFVANTLKEWRVKSASEDLVFVNAKGGPVIYSNIYHRHYRPLFEPTEERSRLPHVKFHRLRHFAVSTWIESGFPPKKVMAFAGHSSITVTFDTYAHLFPDPENDQAAFEEIEAGVLGL